MFICFTTVSSEEEAKKLAETLVRKNLAFCVSYSKCVSHYVWQGNLESTDEYMLMIKCFDPAVVEKELSKIHPYEVPEFIVVSVIHAGRKYEKWAKDTSKC